MSMTVPREALITWPPAFIRANCAEPSLSCVCGVSGTCRVTTSQACSTAFFCWMPRISITTSAITSSAMLRVLENGPRTSRRRMGFNCC